MSTQMNQQIADYFKNQPVVRAWLFGSFARNEQKPWSDIDILVLSARPIAQDTAERLVGLRRRMAAETGCGRLEKCRLSA